MTWLRLQWDRVSAMVLIALGLLVLLIGYIGVSATPYLSEQVPYIISGGLLGIFLLGLGGMFWLSADLRDEWRKLDDLDRTMRTHGVIRVVEEVPVAPEPPAPRRRARP